MLCTSYYTVMPLTLDAPTLGPPTGAGMSRSVEGCSLMRHHGIFLLDALVVVIGSSRPATQALTDTRLAMMDSGQK